MNKERIITINKSNKSSVIEIREKPDIVKSATNIQPRPHSSGFKSFLNWFRRVEKLQKEQHNKDSDDSEDESSSITSGSSTATASSFAFLEPTIYKPYGDALEPKKFISPGPYTDTYRQLIKDRELNQGKDKNLSLRKKYNLHSSAITLNGTLKPVREISESDKNEDIMRYDTFSLPAMQRLSASNNKHRRATSETKFVRPHSFVYVKGKRKAPPPPNSSIVRRRSSKKTRAPPPPEISNQSEGKVVIRETSEIRPEIQHNLVKPIPLIGKRMEEPQNKPQLLHSKSDDNSKTNVETSEIPPRPWYKRQFSENKAKKRNCSDDSKGKNKPDLSDLGILRYSKFFETKKLIINDDNRFNEKRVSRVLPNISELDREANEIFELHKQFEETNDNKVTDGQEQVADAKSARDLINKFNNMQRGVLHRYSELKTEKIPETYSVSKRGQQRRISCFHNQYESMGHAEDTKVWICSQCKKNNDSHRIICFQCYSRKPKDTKFVFENPSAVDKTLNNTADDDDDKEKLKEILIEMKHSLPKRPKSTLIAEDISKNKVLERSFSDDSKPGCSNQSYIATVNVSSNVNSNFPKNLINQHDETKEKSKINSSVQTCSYQTSKSPIMKKNKDLYINLKDSNSLNIVDSAEISEQNNADHKLLLKELESAISVGDDKAAADVAKKLANLKVNCTVIGTANVTNALYNTISVKFYIEDQDSHHGPLPMRVEKQMTISELKRNVEKELNIPANVQRWIIGKQLAVEENKSLEFYNEGDFEQPLFLYLVAAENKCLEGGALQTKENEIKKANIQKSHHIQLLTKQAKTSPQPGPSNENNNEQCNKDEIVSKEDTSTYLELVHLDNVDLIKSRESFECSICLTEVKPNDGVTLRDCLHSFCRECLSNTIKYSEDVQIKCPFRDESYSCQSVVQEREIKSLVPKDVYEQHLAKSVAVAESVMQKTFHCKTADCKGWCIYENRVNYFKCPICKRTNCLTCQAIHDGENCRQYQDRLKQINNPDSIDGRRTKEMLDEMCSKGDAMICPSCKVVLMKKWGCDWLKCSMCKTEICWVTRGPRWGPGGKGDTSGGCMCGLNGVKCHPKCNYCH